MLHSHTSNKVGFRQYYLIIEALNCSWHLILLSLAIGNMTIISLLIRAHSIFYNFHSCLLDNTWFGYILIIFLSHKKYLWPRKEISVSCTWENFQYIIVRYYFTRFQFYLLEIVKRHILSYRDNSVFIDHSIIFTWNFLLRYFFRKVKKGIPSNYNCHILF